MRRTNLALAFILLAPFLFIHQAIANQSDTLFTQSIGGTQELSQLVDHYIESLHQSPVFKNIPELRVLDEPMGSFGIKTMATSLVSTALNYPNYFESNDIEPMFRLTQEQSKEALRLLDASLAKYPANRTAQDTMKKRLLKAKNVLVLVEDQ